MATTSTVQETRIYFFLQNSAGTETTSRYITLPGQFTQGSSEADTIVRRFKAFRNAILNRDGVTTDLKKFIQPSSWRDSTGSSVSAQDATEPWETVDINLELYTVTKHTYDGTEE